MQTRDDQVFDPSKLPDDMHIYLMLFKNGNRIDLTLREEASLLDVLNADLMARVLLDTYVTADIHSIWEGLFMLVETFDKSAYHVAARLGYPYEQKDTEAIVDYLQRVRRDSGNYGG